MIFNVGQGGSSGSGKLVHLIIKTDNSISGATVTATNGSEVLTSTAPTGGGTITLSGKALGTWTITESKKSTSMTVDTVYYGNYEVSIGSVAVINASVTLAPQMDSSYTVPTGYYKPNSVSGFQIQVYDGATLLDTITLTGSTANINVDPAVHSSITIKASAQDGFNTPADQTVTLVSGETKTINVNWVEQYATINVSTEETELAGQTVSAKCGSVTLSGALDSSNECKFIVKSFNTAWTISATSTAGDPVEESVNVGAYFSTNDIELGLMNALIPIMTSYTTPSGTVSADSEYGHASYLAVDGNTDTCWISNESNGGWWQYEFDTAKMVKQVAIRSYIENMMVNTIECSDDGATWETLYDGTIYLEADTFKYIDVSPTKKYKIFKVTMCKTIGYRSVINEIQFYGH